MRLLLNGLTTRVGGGSTVWRALCAGSSEIDALLLVQNSAAGEFVGQGLPNVKVQASNGRLPSLISEARIIEAATKSFRPDAVITQNRISVTQPGFEIPQLALHVNLIRFTGREGTSFLDNATDTVRDELAKWSLRSASANLFESQHLMDAAVQRYPSVKITRPSVAYVGVEGKWTRQTDELLQTAGPRSRLLLSVTSPNPHKDNSRLIQMMSELVDSDPQWRLSIVGGRDPSLWDALRAEIDKAGLGQHIDFLGFLPREELALKLDECFALVSPSLIESFAMVPLEAMARGLPAVVTDRPAMPESVADAAIVCPAGDSSALASAVLRLTVDATWNSYSRMGRERANQLSWGNFSASVIDAVRSIDNQPGA